jgi:hypothetical protein
VNRIKKFYKDHEEALLVLAGAMVGGVLAGAYVASNMEIKTKAGCLIEHVWFEGDTATVRSVNGDFHRYEMGPLQDLATNPVP